MSTYDDYAVLLYAARRIVDEMAALDANAVNLFPKAGLPRTEGQLRSAFSTLHAQIHTIASAFPQFPDLQGLCDTPITGTRAVYAREAQRRLAQYSLLLAHLMSLEVTAIEIKPGPYCAIHDTHDCTRCRKV